MFGNIEENMNLPNVTEKYFKLPNIYPFSGKLQKKTFEQLCDILYESFSTKTDYVKSKFLRYIKQYIIPGASNTEKSSVELVRGKIIEYINQNIIVIDNTNNDKIKYNKSKKKSYFRYVFDSEMTKRISNLIFHDVESVALKLLIPAEDIYIDISYCNLIYYRNDETFFPNYKNISVLPKHLKNNKNYQRNVRQDQRSTRLTPGPDGPHLTPWKKYFLLIGIDSNIEQKEFTQKYDRCECKHKCTCFHNFKHSSEGDIVTYLPYLGFVLKDLAKDYESLYQKKLIPHIFSETSIPSNFLVIPCGLFLSNIKMMKDKYKLVLTLNLWLKCPEISSSNVKKILCNERKHCNCQLCDDNIMENLKILFKKNLYMLPNHLLTTILEYYYLESKKCICSITTESIIFGLHTVCRCTCYKCLSNNTCVSSYKKNYEDSENEEY